MLRFFKIIRHCPKCTDSEAHQNKSMTLIGLPARRFVPWRVFIIATKLNGTKSAAIRVCADMVPHFTRFCAIPHQPACPMRIRHMLLCLHGAVHRIMILTRMLLRDSYCSPDKTCLSPRHMFLRLRITFAPEPEVAKPLLQENG